MNPSHLNELAVAARMHDARLAARDAGRAARRPAAAVGPESYAEHVVIRSARPGDERVLARLAGLDGARVPSGLVLVAELHGRLVAAIDVNGGAPVADPFRPTADVVRLLELRASQLRSAQARPGRASSFAAPARAIRAA